MENGDVRESILDGPISFEEFLTLTELDSDAEDLPVEPQLTKDVFPPKEPERFEDTLPDKLRLNVDDAEDMGFMEQEDSHADNVPEHVEAEQRGAEHLASSCQATPKETKKEKDRRKAKERKARLRETRAEEDRMVKNGELSKEERDRREQERYLRGTLTRERGIEKKKRKERLEKAMKRKEKKILEDMVSFSKNSR